MIEFILNDKKITTKLNPAMTLVDFIRYEKHQKGTKIVCREGDCGACSVLIGTLDSATKSVKYQTITSCISPLANANGKHVVTIEGINIKGTLNQTQKSLKKHHASQCGFCTPGFVIAMTNFCLNKDLNTETEMLDAISGNICRCTGYVSIINSAKEIVQQCKELGASSTLTELINQGFLPAYFEGIALKLINLKRNDNQIRSQKIIAGGTDLYVQKADELIQNSNQRFITLEKSQNIVIEGDTCSISGIATVSDLFNNVKLQKRIPNLKKYLRLISSEAIRNMATISGNFVNASPIGDMTAIFLALEAELTIVNKEKHRDVRLCDFFLDYKVIDLHENESIGKITFQLPKANRFFNFEKVSKRTHLDIATVNTAISLEIENHQIKSANVSFGGVAAIPKYLSKTSDFLKNKPLSLPTIFESITFLHDEISPISDVRGSAEYKRQLAENLYKAHFLELFPDLFAFDEVISQ